MRSKTKIIVLHLKELIYTGILVLLGIGLLFLLLQGCLSLGERRPVNCIRYASADVQNPSFPSPVSHLKNKMHF